MHIDRMVYCAWPDVPLMKVGAIRTLSVSPRIFFLTSAFWWLYRVVWVTQLRVIIV